MPKFKCIVCQSKYNYLKQNVYTILNRLTYYLILNTCYVLLTVQTNSK